MEWAGAYAPARFYSAKGAMPGNGAADLRPGGGPIATESECLRMIEGCRTTGKVRGGATGPIRRAAHVAGRPKIC